MATTPNTTPTDLEFIGHIINDKMEEQPWSKKVANTITAIVGAVVSIAGIVLSMGLSLPDWAMLVVVVVTTLGTALGVRSTKNGFSDSQIAKLQAWQADYISARHTHDETVNPAPDTESPAVTSGEGGDALESTDITSWGGRHTLNPAVLGKNLDASGLSDLIARFNRNRGA